MERITILFLEDSLGDARLIQDMLADTPSIEFVIDWKKTLQEGLQSLTGSPYDAVLLDLGLPDSPQRSATLTRIQSAAPTLPIVILTGLDDESFALGMVRRGAQDYLVKGRFDSLTLVRTIRYAIARRLGGERTWTLEELAAYDGKEGRPAYVAFQGKVFNATGNDRWKNGLHGLKHQAGKDLTEDMRQAPHGEEVLHRLPIVGKLISKENQPNRLFRRIDSLHIHTTLVHLTIAYAFITPFTFLLWLFQRGHIFEEMTLVLLVFGLITVPLSFVTGLIGWTVSYESVATRIFNYKIALGILLFFIVLGTLIWRLTGQETILNSPGRYLYLGSLVVQSALVLILDYYGKKTVYSS
jgi:predicted heme/steroid binding protein/uncharacterized membrane protein